MSRNTVAILSIGTELTRGELTNTNASWLAAELVARGYEPSLQLVVDDDDERMIDSLRLLSARAGAIVCTGGLGPTSDDRTSQAAATLLGVDMQRDAASLAHIRGRFEKIGRPMSPSNEKQADFPLGATILANPIGTAPGFSVLLPSEGAADGARAFFMPGVPKEMKQMFLEQVLPRIAHLSAHDGHQIRMRTFGQSESMVGELLAGLEGAHPGVTIGYRAHFPEIEVKVLAKHPSNAKALAERVAGEVRARLGDLVFGDETDTYAGVTVAALARAGLKVGLAESCSGGLATQLLSRVPGVSRVLLGGAVPYDNKLKVEMLGVQKSQIEVHGAVSEAVALAMAEGIWALALPELPGRTAAHPKNRWAPCTLHAAQPNKWSAKR
jgi:nicotinamide-nucleotide amidase